MTGPRRRRRTLVVGLGNPLLGDDGVGWAVVDALAAGYGEGRPGIELDRLAVGGLTLMERLTGFDRAIIVDALVSGRSAPGTLALLDDRDLAGRGPAHLDSAHDVPIAIALRAGRHLGARLPAEIVVVGIEAARVDTFEAALSPSVAEAVPRAVELVLGLLGDGPGARSVRPRRRESRIGGRSRSSGGPVGPRPRALRPCPGSAGERTF